MTQQDLNEKLREIFDEITAKGWPNYSENKNLCMERAREFLDKRNELFHELLKDSTSQNISDLFSESLDKPLDKVLQ